MASEFEKKYGESLAVFQHTNVFKIAEFDALIQKEREVTRAEGEQFVLQDRKNGFYYFAAEDGTFTLPKKNDYVIFLKKEADIAKLRTEQAAKEKETAERQKKESEGNKSTEKRDFLRAIEIEVQRQWKENKTFELDAPADVSKPKYMATFPYPYMNGKLHLGHSFTVSKAEFAVGYERLKGKQALFPFGFHCTGMPIKACADKIKREIDTYGNPPKFPVVPETADIKVYLFEENRPKKKGEAKSKKAKANAKTDSKIVYQWDIMKSSHVPEAELPSFADANHWLYYFPPLAIEDLNAMGLKADWRRTFITTDVNAYYDAFVRWQFIRLKEAKKIAFGKRYTIYSARDGGPCMDHDRQTGEGVAPQEYTLVKQELVKPFPAALKRLEDSGKKVYLVPATLRPETMYGQTNCWVLPDGEYGAFEVNDNEIFICTERAARNLSFQNWSHTFGEHKQVLSFKGSDLLGAAIHAPLTAYEKIYVLPMFSINTQKTTGIVTSVPSDSPDDYAAYNDCKKKIADYKKNWGITEEMVNLPIIDIINVPGLGDRVAETLVNQLGIKSQNDRALLDKAKETAYQKGFYEGTMIIGEYKGTKVEQAKALIREKLVKEGVALAYCEPTSQVISRSGEECVVALIDQWYIDYGEEEWRKLAERCLSLLDTYSEETRNQFKGALDWMKQWACSRSYGLGTKLPWDESYLIDSLSDSTIYMAYYSIAHILHNGSLDGANGNPQIPASEMTPEVFDYIFLGKEAPKTTNIPVELLQKMKQEFEYWYPVDLRVSGKDLIPNHLTFFIYNHTALFGESKWPKGIRANGHILLNNQKMSKSTGNFITLGEAVERYSADGMRFALADAGDSLEDANFTDDTANSAILRLYTQIQWIKETTESKDLREGEPSTFFDKVFLNQMRECVDRADSAYSRTNYKEAVKAAFYDIQTARDEYRVACTSAGIQPNKQLFTTFCEVQTVILAPICPHACEHIWGKILGKAGTVTSAQWPSIGSADTIILRQKHYVDYMISTIRTKIMQVLKKKGAVKPTTCTLFVAKKYPAWQEAAIKLVEKFYIEAGKQMPPKAKIADAAKTEPAFQSNGKLDGAIHKKAMAFLAQIEADVVERGADAFALEVPFSEIEVLNDNLASFKKQLNLDNIVIYSTDDEAVAADTKKDNAVPGKPAVHLQ